VNQNRIEIMDFSHLFKSGGDTAQACRIEACAATVMVTQW